MAHPMATCDRIGGRRHQPARPEPRVGGRRVAILPSRQVDDRRRVVPPSRRPGEQATTRARPRTVRAGALRTSPPGAATGGRRRPLWIGVGRHAADAIGVAHLAAVLGEHVIAFVFTHLIVGGPDGSLCGSGHTRVHQQAPCRHGTGGRKISGTSNRGSSVDDVSPPPPRCERPVRMASISAPEATACRMNAGGS